MLRESVDRVLTKATVVTATTKMEVVVAPSRDRFLLVAAVVVGVRDLLFPTAIVNCFREVAACYCGSSLSRWAAACCCR